MLLALSVGIPMLASAQQNRTVTGTVRDAAGPVIGASVLVPGNNSLGTIPANYEDFRDAIIEERKLEFAFEGWRVSGCTTRCSPRQRRI